MRGASSVVERKQACEGPEGEYKYGSTLSLTYALDAVDV